MSEATMDTERTARQFRMLAETRGACLEDPTESDETQHYFELRSGIIVTTRHRSQVEALIAIAEEVYGRGQGEHAELLALRAKLDDVRTSALEVVHWSSAHTGPGTVSLNDWRPSLL